MDENHNPWTTLSQSVAYENNWIRVDHHEVRNPAGGPGIYGVVRFKFHAIGVVPIDQNGDVILVGQYRYPLGQYSWEIPEGGGAAGVPSVDSAKRELREECGIEARHWLEILQMDLSNSITDERGTAFLAWDFTHGVSQPEDTELLKVARLPFWETIDRVKRGEIRDAVSVTALQRVALMALQGDLPEPVAKLISPK